MAYTIGGLFLTARNTLNDVIQTSGAFRYSDQELMDAFNEALVMARAKRPDAFLDMGLRNPVPQYQVATDEALNFPLDVGYVPAFVFYIIGRIELKEDTFTNDSRAVSLMNKFVSLLLQVAS
jgi:hypothetical protein